METIVDIVIYDELAEDVIQSNAKLNLQNGCISDIKYIDYSIKEEGLPADRDDYEFTSGLLSFDKKELEFAISIVDDEYVLSEKELSEVKEKILKLSKNISSINVNGKKLKK